MGLFVEIPNLSLRGAVKREDLPGERWRFESFRMAWVNWEGQSIQLGMRLPLEVASVNRERRFVDFRIAVSADQPVGKTERFNPPIDPRGKQGKPGKAPKIAKGKPGPSAKDVKQQRAEETKGKKPFPQAKFGGKKGKKRR